MALFGMSITPAPTINNAMSTILAGPPPLTNPLGHCGPGDVACATFQIAVSIIAIPAYPVTLLVWAISKILAFFSFISIAILGPQQGAAATPFVGFVWALLFGYVIFEVIRIFRGNSTAGV